MTQAYSARIRMKHSHGIAPNDPGPHIQAQCPKLYRFLWLLCIRESDPAGPVVCRLAFQPVSVGGLREPTGLSSAYKYSQNHFRNKPDPCVYSFTMLFEPPAVRQPTDNILFRKIKTLLGVAVIKFAHSPSASPAGACRDGSTRPSHSTV
jgi:hypothetical protein